jgi:hypothetical protein
MIIQKKLEQIKQKFSEIYGDNLITLYLYSDFKDDLEKEKQDIVNLLLILKSVDIKELNLHQNNQKLIVKKFFNKTPITIKIFTKEELLNSLDVFPIEFLNLKESRVLLLGKDVLEDIKIDQQNLRHECEFYLRTHILKLREGFIQPKRNEAQLIRESLPFLLSIFKYLLLLLKQKIPKEKSEIVLHLAHKIDFNKDVFYRIIGNLDSNKLGNYFEKYLTELEKIVKKVDKLEF